MNQEEKSIMEQYIKAQSYAAQTHAKIKGKPMNEFEIEQFELALECAYHAGFQHRELTSNQVILN